MPLEGDAKQLEDFFATYASEERKLYEQTIENLLLLGRTACLVDEPFNVETLRQATGRAGAFGYDQLGRTATWIEPARLALACHWVEEHGDGDRILSLRATPTANNHFTALRLVTIDPAPRTINCVVMPETELRETWLRQLVSPLIGPRFGRVQITVVETERHVAPLAHPLRGLGERIEYALRVDLRDDAPRQQTDLTRDPRARIGRSVGATLAHATGGIAAVHDLDDPALVEMVATVEDAEGVHLLARPLLREEPALARGARLLNQARRDRTRVLCEMAYALPHAPHPADTRAIVDFVPRESGVTAENLCLLLAVLDAAGVPVVVAP